MYHVIRGEGHYHISAALQSKSSEDTMTAHQKTKIYLIYCISALVTSRLVQLLYYVPLTRLAFNDSLIIIFVLSYRVTDRAVVGSDGV